VYQNLSSEGPGASYTFPGGYGSLTDEAGVYLDEVVPGWNYHVLFGNDLGSGPDYAPAYTPCDSFCGFEQQWYSGAPTYDAGSTATVDLYGTTPGIDARLTPIPLASP
jgi:hypothetical protein